MRFCHRPSRRVVMEFRVHELKRVVDARFRTITHTVTNTIAVDACVGMATKSILASRGRKQGSPQMSVSRGESSRGNYVNIITSLLKKAKQLKLARNGSLWFRTDITDPPTELGVQALLDED